MNTLRQLAIRTLQTTIGPSRTNDLYDRCLGITYLTQARDSRRHLQALHNAYTGRRCFIIGNGPSLRKTPLHLLRNEVTFGLNRIYLMFEELGFTTTFLVCMNLHVIDQFQEDLLRQPLPKFLNWRGRDAVPANAEDVTFLLSQMEPLFRGNLLEGGLWEGATVTYVAMQLAYHMGFSEVVLVGVDHSFVTQGKPHELVTTPDGGDPNHFSPQYFGPGVRWQLPDLETSEVAYQMAREAFAADGRSIIDATVGGKLTVFPKRELHDFF